jgi:hypothetical protein
MPRQIVSRSALLLFTLAAGCTRAGPGAAAAGTARGDVPPRAADEAEVESDTDRPSAHVARSGRVTLRAFELAGRVTWQGVSACAGAVGGLFEDGWDGASARWRSGTAATRDVAASQADHLRHAARDDEQP